MNDGPRVAVVAQSDFHNFPIGGVTTFARTVTPFIDLPLLAVGIDSDRKRSARRMVRLGRRCIPYLSLGVGRQESAIPLRTQTAALTFARRHQLRAIGPDLYYVHSPEMGPALPRSGDAPRVYQLHGASLTTMSSAHRFLRNSLGTRIFADMIKWNVRHAALVLGVNEECRDLAESLDKPYLHVPPAVDTEVFHVPVRVASHRVRIGYLGRVDDNKNVGFVVDVLATLVREGYEASLVVGGGGAALERLVARVREEGLSPRVTFLGPVDPAGARDTLARSDVFVLASGYEGLPTALLEAMSCECAIVARGLPGVRSVVSHGVNGFVFDDFDPEHVASLVLKAWRAREVLGAAARATVMTTYSAAAVGAQLTSAFRRLVCA